jgi:glycosyltransferase involved in cell wall biosynthesis
VSGASTEHVPVLVTVYIPTRNRPDLLRRAIDSVLAQDHAALELIVVDDGSTDETPELLRACAAADRRVTFLRNDQPVGAPKSRNRAILGAKGDFVTGLDDDDYFAPTRLGSFLRAWQRLADRGTKPAGLYSQGIILTPQGTSTTARPPTQDYRQLLVQNALGNQLFAPRAHYIEAGLFDESLPAWQDLDLFIRILRRFGTAHLVDEPTYYHDESHGGERISGKGTRVRAAMEILREKYRDADAAAATDLMMQMFNGYYGIRPTWRDLAYLLAHQPSAARLLRLLKRCVRP